jgi:hypothetical protein
MSEIFGNYYFLILTFLDNVIKCGCMCFNLLNKREILICVYKY